MGVKTQGTSKISAQKKLKREGKSSETFSLNNKKKCQGFSLKELQEKEEEQETQPFETLTVETQLQETQQQTLVIPKFVPLSLPPVKRS